NLVTEEYVKVYGIVMMAYEVDADGTVMMANEEVVPEINTTWYLDTAASNHMCGEKQLLEEMKEVVNGCVTFGNDSNVKVKEGSALGQKSKNVFHGKQHEHRPQNLAYWLLESGSRIRMLYD
ncbi:hypothetical protein Tco_0495030, partial [Tanacetum coccineum]